MKMDHRIDVPLKPLPTHYPLILLLCLLILANDIELNPGPRALKYPCGVCSKAVKWKDHGVACDSCNVWFHTACIGMYDEIYRSLSPDISWNCFTCGLPNFSTLLFADTPAGSTLPPSLQDLTHASTASLSLSQPRSPNSPEPQQSLQNSSPPVHLKPPTHASSPHGLERNTQQNITVSSMSSILSAPDPMLDFAKVVQPDQSLRTLTINFRSIRNKKQEFWNLLESTSPDIILGSETWLNPSIYNSEICPPTFDIYRKDRPDGWGGVLVAVRKTLISHQIQTNPDAEAVLVSIQTKNKSSRLIVGSLYRPPSATSQQYTESLLSVVDLACRSAKDVVWLGGDLNLPSINWSTLAVEGNNYGKELNEQYLSKFRENGLSQTNASTTRGKSLLDLFFTNRPSLSTRTCLLPALSDHDVVMSDNRICPERCKPIPRTVYIWKKANIEEMKKDISELSVTVTNSTTNQTVEETWQCIHSALTDTMKRNVPTKTTSTKFHQPWANNLVKRLSRRKNRAWAKAKRTDKDKDWKRFDSLQKECRRASRRAYNKYTSHMVTKDGHSKLYRFIKSKKNDAHGVSPLKSEGLTHSDPTMKANILNDQFCSVFTKENLDQLPHLGESPYPAMPDIQVNVKGVTKLLRQLNPRKAAGPDEIPCRLLVTVADELAPALTHLFQLSLQSGKIPNSWRHALVQPVYKKGDRSTAANYRPISLTSVCCKLLEHVVRSGITNHLESNKILSNAQHGFRKQRSCESQLLLTIDDLGSALDDGGQTDAILLDFSKAFDVVPHKRLLLKLHHYGIRGQTLAWIEDFLSHRTQQVAVEGKLSSIGQVTSGVPQGSVLGPTLFLVFINDLSKNIKSTVRLFADDTILYRQIKTSIDPAILQQDLDQLQVWEKTWQMQFNASKCHVLSVSKKKETTRTSYSIHGEILQNVDSAKYLGIEISKDLSWKKHINSITNKANKTSAFLYRNLRSCPRRTQTTCYKTIARPLLEYASPVWDPPQEYLAQDLEKVQRRAARRIMHDFRTTTSASELVSKLELDTLKLRRTAAKATTMYKVVNGLVEATPERQILIPTGRNSRGHNMKFRTPYCRTDVMKNTFFPSAISLWNSLPQEAISANTPEAFRTTVEGWLRERSH